MKKLILSILFIICLSFQARPAFALDGNIILASLDQKEGQLYAWNIMLVGSGKPTAAADPCTTMGASGTYELWANGEYPSDVHYACQDSGTGVDATDEVAGVAVVGGKINGTYGYLLDAADEHVRWDAPAINTIDVAGTVQMTVTVPATTNDQSALWEIYYDAQNFIIGYFSNTSSAMYSRIEGSDNADFTDSGASSVTDGTTITVYWTWRTTGTEKHCVKIDAGGWVCDEEDLDSFTNDPDDISVGDDQRGLISVGDSWKVDDFQVREGYEGD